MARIYHRNIRRLHDYLLDKKGEKILILSELCGGGTLSSLVSESRMSIMAFSPAFIEDIFFQLTQAVQHMHYYLDGPVKRRPLIIDPKSVHFTNHGVLKVDFIRVLICSQEPEVRQALSRGVYGGLTAREIARRYVGPGPGLDWYMAPETKEARFFTEKTSIYSIGSVLYELLVVGEPLSLDLRLLPSQVASFSQIGATATVFLTELLLLARSENQRERANAAQLVAKMNEAGITVKMELRQGIVRIDGNYTMLMEAARENNHMAARLSIGQAGLLSNEGLTALMIASILNHSRVAKLLLKREAFFTIRNFTVRGWRFTDATALMLGAVHGSIDVCRLLLPVEGGMQTPKGWTALIYAAGCRQVSTTTLLMDKEARMCTNELSNFGRGFTALMFAAYSDCPETCFLLAKKEANLFTAPSNKNYPSWSALVFAAATCSLDCTRILLDYEGPSFAGLALQSVGKLKRKATSDAIESCIYSEILAYTHDLAAQSSGLATSASSSSLGPSRSRMSLHTHHAVDPKKERTAKPRFSYKLMHLTPKA